MKNGFSTNIRPLLNSMISSIKCKLGWRAFVCDKEGDDLWVFDTKASNNRPRAIRHEYTNPCCRLQITKATQIERRAGKRPPCRLRWLEDLLWRPRGVSGGLNLPTPNSAPGSSNKYQKAFVDGPQKGHRIHVYDVNIFPPLPPSQ